MNEPIAYDNAVNRLEVKRQRPLKRMSTTAAAKEFT